MSQRSRSSSYRSIKCDCHYLKALILKLMHRYHEAQENYFIFRKFYLYEEKQRMVLTCFGVLMLPLNDDRR